MYIERTHRTAHRALRTYVAHRDYVASEPSRRPRASRGTSPSPSLSPRDHPRYFRITDRLLFTRPRANAATFPSRTAKARASRASRAASTRARAATRPRAATRRGRPLDALRRRRCRRRRLPRLARRRDGRAGGAGGLADRQLIAANDATIFNFDRASPSWTRRSVGGARRFSGDAPRDAEPPGDTSPPAPRAANVASTAARAAASISSRVWWSNPEFARPPPRGFRRPRPEPNARDVRGSPAPSPPRTARWTGATLGLFAGVDIAVRRPILPTRARARSRSTSARTVAAPAVSEWMDAGSSRGGDSPKSTNAVDLDGAVDACPPHRGPGRPPRCRARSRVRSRPGALGERARRVRKRAKSPAARSGASSAARPEQHGEEALLARPAALRPAAPRAASRSSSRRLAAKFLRRPPSAARAPCRAAAEPRAPLEHVARLGHRRRNLGLDAVPDLARGGAPSALSSATRETALRRRAPRLHRSHSASSPRNSSSR